MSFATNRPGGPGILRMSAPLIVSFWMRSLFSLVDTLYAATLGDAAVAAVGLAIPLEFLMIACWVGVSTGLTSTLSRAMGAGQDERIDQLMAAARRIVILMVPAFVLIGAGVYLGAPGLGLEPEVARLFGIYGSVLVCGSAFSSFWSILPDSLVKAHHDTRSTMWAGIWSNVINVVLNTVFTFGFHWGIFGIAFSTVLGRLGGLIYALRRAAALEAARRSQRATPPAAGIEPHPYRAILGLAVPSAATFALMALEGSLVNGLLSRLDRATEAIAAYGIYYRVLLLSLMPIMATGVAMLPYVARRFGERDLAGIRRGLSQALWASAAYGLLVAGPVLYLGAGRISAWLAESEVTASFTIVALRICPLACLAAAPFILVRPAFEGMQRGQPGLVMALARYVVLTVPMAAGGAWIAPRLGATAFTGMLCGLVAASAAVSAAFLAWIARSVGRSGSASRGWPEPAPSPLQDP